MITLQKTLRGKPHNVDCVESTYHETMKVIKGRVTCKLRQTAQVLQSRGYVVVTDAAPAPNPQTPPAADTSDTPAPAKKKTKKKAAPKTD